MYCTSSFMPRRKELVNARAAHLKHEYPTLENQAESLMNDSSVKLTKSRRVKYLFLTEKVDNSFLFLSGSASTIEVVK